MILDTITSSPLNVIFTIVLGLGLAYLYCRRPSSSSSSSSSSSRSQRSGATRDQFTNSGGVISEDLQRTIAQIERQERDMIRQEQDEAYQQSLRADREKQLKKEEELREKEARERQERERKQCLEELHKKLTKLRGEISEHLPSEHNNKEADVVKFVFKLPDGTRIKRNFLKQDRVKHLYWYVFSLQNAPLQFRLTTNFPKRDLPGRPPVPEDFNHDPQAKANEPNCEETLDEANLTETQTIFVHDLEA